MDEDGIDPNMDPELAMVSLKLPAGVKREITL